MINPVNALLALAVITYEQLSTGGSRGLSRGGKRTALSCATCFQ